jgi:ABC-type Fe3+ transport system substrate-binding protein
MGVATSFIAFLAGPEGQRILLKAGLFPARSPVRLIELKEEQINVGAAEEKK